MGAAKHHKSEGGQGGRRGHSNMNHWVTTEEVKDATRVLRRREAKKQITEQVQGLTEGTLDAVTRRKNILKKQVACKALRTRGTTPKGKAPMSAYDLVIDLIGKQSGGPGDLSTNPKYMEGFGR